MHLVINDTEYRVRFTYSNGINQKTINPLTDTDNKSIRTICDISSRKVGDTSPEGWVGLAGATITRHPNDPFDKSLGRRTALGYAVQQLADRKIRSEIWDKYFLEHHDGKKLTIHKKKRVKSPVIVGKPRVNTSLENAFIE